MSKGYIHPEVLVSTEWVAENLGQYGQGSFGWSRMKICCCTAQAISKTRFILIGSRI